MDNIIILFYKKNRVKGKRVKINSLPFFYFAK
nr:MAG TPA: hypothetical protein [Caudoviricetes sp.]